MGFNINGENIDVTKFINDPYPGNNNTGAKFLLSKANNNINWGMTFIRNSHSLVENADGSELVGYGPKGEIYAKATSDDDYSVVNKKYGDENYRKIVTGSSNEIKVYTTKYGDTESWMFLNSDPDGTPGAEIPMYGVGGTLRSNMPTIVLDNSVINKKYADEKIGRASCRERV